MVPIIEIKQFYLINVNETYDLQIDSDMALKSRLEIPGFCDCWSLKIAENAIVFPFK